MKHRFKLLGLAVALFCLSGSAFADAIGPDCGPGNCLGTVYMLQYNPVPESTTATTQTFDIILTLDTSATTAGPLIPAVAIKVAPSATGALDSAPAIVGGWTEIDGGLNASGCNGAGSGFVCAEANIFANAPTVPDGIYQWVFDVTVPTGTLLTGLNAAHVKALYGEIESTGAFKSNGITSADITLQKTPEPGTILLFGSGLLGLGAKLRRRRKA